MSTTFLLLLLLGTALAATHVNISIAQHPAINPADVTYVEGMAPAELRAGPANRASDERSAKLRTADDTNNAEATQKQIAEQRANVNAARTDPEPETRVARVQQGASVRQAHFRQPQAFGGQTYQHSQFSQHGQFRQPNQQDIQNQEFERYIQSYHSGPTVETVFDSASPAPQRQQSASSAVTSVSSSSAGPQRVVTIAARPAQKHTFERQIALPSVSPSVLPAADANRQTHTIADHQPQLAADANVQSAASTSAISASSSSSSSSSTASNAAALNNGNHFEASKAAPSFEQTNFDQANTYSKPNYDQSNSNYDQSNSNYDQSNSNYGDGQHTALSNVYPPSVDEPQDGFAGFYVGHDQSNYFRGHGEYPSSGGYSPTQTVFQRPVVTKTIQIAQPALKAKKYEVRHPAIQKEFYDIEERVVIKPAGTIVVELERPVAKIPKGETILPLGHPHPAIAGEYHNNGHSDIQTQLSSAGTYSSGSRANNGHNMDNQNYGHSMNNQNNIHQSNHNQNTQNNLNKSFGPPPVYAARTGQDYIGSNTVASTVITTPTYDHSSKGDLVEANLKKQYGGEVRFVATADEKPRKELFIAADTNGSQRQIPGKNLSPNMFSRDEPDFSRPAHVDIQNNDAPMQAHYANSEQNAANHNAPQLHSNYNANDDTDDFNGEYITGNFYNTPNRQQDAKPARLQEQPAVSSADAAEPRTHIIKHEHNIHLPPTQHNIYLGRLEQRPAPVAAVAPSEPQHQQQQQQQQQQYHQQPLSAQLKDSRFEDEAARVLEIKPYLQQHRGAVVLYAPVPERSAHTSQRFTESEPRQRPQVSQQRSFARLRYGAVAGPNGLEYSSSYSNMRYLPQESARLTAEVKAESNDKPAQRTVTVNYHRGPETRANLIAQEKSEEKQEANQAETKSEMRPHTHIQIQIPHQQHEAGMPIMVSSTISPPMDQPRPAHFRQQSGNSASSHGGDNEVERFSADSASTRGDQDQDGVAHSANLDEPDCDQTTNKFSARYQNEPQAYHSSRPSHTAAQQQFMRLVETPNASAKDAPATPAPVTNIQPDNIDVNVKSSAGHVATSGSRVIAATAAPTDASASSESFHKRRIVVNHPFQTVREVVEHEPVTNYHQIQVNEPASPALYHQAYYQPSGALRQAVPVVYHHAPVTHGHLRYALPDAIPVHERDEHDVTVSYHQQQRQQRQQRA